MHVAGVNGALVHGIPSLKTRSLPPYHVVARMASTVSTGVEANGDSNDPSSSTVLYPFPKHKHPTPYEIFHLKPGASPSAVKNRYYQLVKLHHPDAPHSRLLPASVSHERFQAIQIAHDVLTGKMRRQDHPSPMYQRARPSHATAHRSQADMDMPMGERWQHSARYHAHNSYAEWSQAAPEEFSEDDQAKHRTFMIIGAMAVSLTIIPFLSSSALSDSRHRSAVRNLSEARKEAREVGHVRRAEIRRQVRRNELEREYEERIASDEGSGPPVSSSAH